MPTDLSRYDDWTDLARPSRAPPTPTSASCGSAAPPPPGGYDEWSDLDVDLLCTPGEADAVHDRLLARVRADFDGRPRLGAAEGHLAGRPPVLREPPGTARAPSRSRPGSSTCTSRSSPTRTGSSTYAGTARRSCVHDPDGLVELRARRRGRDAAPRSPRPSTRSGSAGRPPSGWSTGRSAAGSTAEAVAALPRRSR